jgi:hypothetical protein
MAANPITERELPRLIVDQLARETDLPLTYRELEQPVGRAVIDGVLALGDEATLYAEVKRDLRKRHAKQTLHQIQHLQELLPDADYTPPFVLLTRYLSQAQRDYLRQGRLYFADLAGNAYLKLNGNFIWIEGKSKKALPSVSDEIPFTPAAMRLAFAYLLQPDLIQRPYREQAELSGVAKSTIGDHLQAFVQAGYLTRTTIHQWQDRERLAKDWIRAYPRVLKPTLPLTRFRLPRRLDPRDWAEIWPGNQQLQWGGEPAGALLTGYLQPGAYTLYSRLTTAEVLITLRAIPDPEGPFEVFKTFWPEALDESKNRVHPFLAYADLVDTQDTRKLKIATIIHEHFLADLFRQPEAQHVPNTF